ncbi:MAG: asparagine synthase-related protein, partial [Gammaproteobacteria bacterium]
NEDLRYFRLVDRSEASRNIFQPHIFADDDSFNRFQQVFNQPNTNSFINKMLNFDLKASLPALLHVEDRTSMAVSIESRVPLLDHKIVEFLATVPPHLKFANGQTKYLFREAIKFIVPQKILNRKDKKGFPVPLNHWFKGVAKEYVEDILFSERIKSRGLFNMPELEKLYLSNQQFSRSLWGALCLESWFRLFID